MKTIGTWQQRLERDEQGLTLVELLVVLLVIGILLGIAIPTFLSAQNGSKDAAAKSHAVQALKTQKTLLISEGAFASDDATLTSVEPSLDFRRFSDPAEEGEARVLGAIYIREATGNVLTLAAKSATGVCFWTRVLADGTTRYAKGTCKDSEISTLTWESEW